MWNILKCISRPYQIISLSFPLKSRLEQFQIKVQWHWKVSGVVFAYFEKGTWIFGEEAGFLTRTGLLRSQNVGSVSYYLRQLQFPNRASLSDVVIIVSTISLPQ